MAENQVETGIVIKGDAREGIGALRSVADEGQKMGKRLDTVKKSVAELPDKLGKASTAMLLFQNATSQLGGKVADAVNKLTAVAGLAATGGPLGLALAGVTAATIAGAAAWELYNAETVAAENAQKSLARIFDESDKRLRDQELTLARLTDEVENYGKTSRQVQIEELERSIAVTENAREAKERDIETMRRSAREMNERAKAIEATIGMMDNFAERQRLGIKDADKESKALRDRARHLETTAAAMEKGLKRGIETAENNKKIIATIGELQAKEQDAVNRRERANRQRQKAIELERERIRQERERIAQEKEAAALLAKRMTDVDAFVAQRNAARDEELRREFEVMRTLDAVQAEHADKQKARREADAAHLASVMTSVVQIVGDTQATALEKVIALTDMVKQAVIRLIIEKISAYAVDAAAGALTNSITTLPPPAGIILGATAAAAAFAAVTAWTQKLNAGGFVLPSPQAGGFVRGGVTNRDSVNATLTPGEYVASTGEVGGFIKFATRLLGNERAKSMADMAGMRGNRETQQAPVNQQTIVINNRALVPTRNEQIRTSRLLAQNARRMRQLGMGAG